jgi:isopenicillin N synthase-like dioxygenase
MSDWDAAAQAHQVGAAARGVGFFYLAGHGVDSRLLAEVLAQSARYFALPETEKSKQSIAHSPHTLGYVAMKSESQARKVNFKCGIGHGRRLMGSVPE